MRVVARTDLHRALLWLGVVGGLILSVGGCGTEGREPSNGVVSEGAAESTQPTEAAIAATASSGRLLLQSSSAIQDEDNLDPFGSLPIGIGFDTYTAECDPIADPFATCL